MIEINTSQGKTNSMIVSNTASANWGRQIISTGVATTMNDGVETLIVNPSSVLATHTITLPPNPLRGQKLYILFGGTITSGPVVTTLSIIGNAGQTILL